MIVTAMPRDLRHSLRSDLAGSAFGQPGEVSNSTRMIASIASPPVGCLVGSGHVVCTCSATATGPDPDRPHSSASDAPPATLSTKSPQTETRPQPRSMWDNRTVLGFATKTGKTPSPPLPESRQLRSSGSWAFANQKRNLQLLLLHQPGAHPGCSWATTRRGPPVTSTSRPVRGPRPCWRPPNASCVHRNGPTAHAAAGWRPDPENVPPGMPAPSGAATRFRVDTGCGGARPLRPAGAVRARCRSWVTAPWARLLPEEYSEGTRPR